MAECPHSNISIMQLFHRLKQQFPAVPDQVITECIKKNAHDRGKCETVLGRANEVYLPHSYPLALMARRPSSLSLRGNEVSRCGGGQSSDCGGSVSDVRMQWGDDETSVKVVYSAPSTPGGAPSPRHRAQLSIDPAPSSRLDCTPAVRPFTSVNLTLRPPSDTPQPPIDIETAGSCLTYTTHSYSDRQGYQSQLRISIGPGGRGSVSAVRRSLPSSSRQSSVLQHPPSPLLRPARASSMPDVATASLSNHCSSQELLNEQLERKERLECELIRETERLHAMQSQAREMERSLEVRLKMPTTSPKVQRLREEIDKLQEECKRMTCEVDLSSVSPVPLGETDENFYKHIYTGQSGSCIIAPCPNRHRSTRESRAEESSLVVNWQCHMCTFKNHPLLDKCEACEMPRIIPGVGETQNIHIHVTHHNVPRRITLMSRWMSEDDRKIICSNAPHTKQNIGYIIGMKTDSGVATSVLRDIFGMPKYYGHGLKKN